VARRAEIWRGRRKSKGKNRWKGEAENTHTQASGLQAITQTVGIVARGKPDTRLFAFRFRRRFRRRRRLAVGRKIKKKIRPPSMHTEQLYVCERIYSVYIT